MRYKNKCIIVIVLLILSIVTACSDDRYVSFEEINITYNNKKYTGFYSGTLINGKPNGEGTFSDEGGFDFIGTWEDGKPLTGNIDVDEFILNFQEFNSYGRYSGEIVDGMADGDGVFISENDANEEWTHTGEYENNMLNGNGFTIWVNQEGEVVYTEEGNYTDGEFEPLLSDIFNSVIKNNVDDIDITSIAREFIDNNENIFLEDKNSFEHLVQGDLEYEKYAKSQINYGDGLYKIESAFVIQAAEFEYYDSLMTYLLVSDENGFIYTLYYYNVADIYIGDLISATILPLNYSTYETIKNELMFTINSAVVDITKVSK